MYKKLISIIILISVVFSCSTEHTDKPNVVIILADDLGYNQLGCHGGPYETPSLDSLASQGMSFVQAYASAAVCSPTRAALMTGLYPARLHLTDFIKGNGFPDSMLIQPDWQKYLPLEEVTMAELFRDHGYETAIFGKWHLSQEKRPPESIPYNPDKQGFNEYMVTYKPDAGNTDPEYDPHNVDSITNRSIQFLKDHGKNPFLLVVSHNSIHDPVMESEARINRYREAYPVSDYSVHPELGAMVNRLDESTGRLLLELRSLGLEGNTIVLFCSDNGGKEAYASQFPYRKGKGWLYEGGIRVPMIVRWPEQILPGSFSNAICATMDIFPTLMELTGMQSHEQQFDGISLAGEILDRVELKDKVELIEERALFWHYPHYHKGSGMSPASAIRRGNYKLIEWHGEFLKGEDAWELYDLGYDPGETNNLVKMQPDLLRSMQVELHNWRKEVNAQMPELR